MVEMLKLGKSITQSTTAVDIYSFDLEQMLWSRMAFSINFTIDQDPFGRGGFHEAYKATSITDGFKKHNLGHQKVESLSTDVFEPQTATGRRMFKVLANLYLQK